jgi:hypothetical protein
MSINWTGDDVPYSAGNVADCSQTDITTNMVISQTSHDRAVGALMLGDTDGV